MAKAKKIVSNDIINQAKQAFKPREVVVEAINGKEYKVKIQDNINDTKIAELMTDLLERSEWYKENNLTFNIVQVIYILMLKHFTDIDFRVTENKDEDYANEVNLCNALVDLGLFKAIMEHFTDESSKKIQDAFDVYAKNIKSVHQNEMFKEIVSQANGLSE